MAASLSSRSISRLAPRGWSLFAGFRLPSVRQLVLTPPLPLSLPAPAVGTQLAPPAGAWSWLASLRMSHVLQAVLVPPLSLLPAPAHSALASWLGHLWMAVPKKRTSRKVTRLRRAGQAAQKAPKLKSNMYMCPVCERMRVPHRVCAREDCSTYFRNRHF